MMARTDVDHYLIKVVLQANRDEIAMGRLANQRSANQDVKKFATQMVDDHTRLMSSLQQFQSKQHTGAMPGARQPGYNDVNRGTLNNAPANTTGTQRESRDTANDHNATNGTLNGAPTTAGTQGQSQDSANDHNATSGALNGAPATTGTQSQAGSDTANDHNAANQNQINPAPGSFNQPGRNGQRFGNQMVGQNGMAGRRSAAHQFATIMEEVANQTQQSVQRELSQKEGAQFDRCYLSRQVMDHMWLVDALTVFERNASPALQPILQEGLQVAQQHLAHAKALLARIEQGQAKSTAQRESETPIAR
jgi:predicted outer membrane protein